MAIKHEGEEDPRGPGITERVAGTVKRAVGAVGRAARGAVGRAEAGSDELFLALHADHEEVTQLFEKLFQAGDPLRAQELWSRLSVALLTHLRAEQETVYERLSSEEELVEDADHSLEEHEDIEELLFLANNRQPGSEEFTTRVRELEQSVRRHVDDEENDLLPKVVEILSDSEREQLVARFRERKDQIEPKIAIELTGKEEPRPRRRARPPEGRKIARPRRAPDLEGRTLKELQELARKRGIEGRSRMKKKELIAALSRSAS